MSKSAQLKVYFLIATFLIVAMQPLTSIAKANPFIPKGSVAQEPTLPLIEVQSPSKEEKLEALNDVWLQFKVTVPKTSWGSIGTTFGSITSVSYILDSDQKQTVNLTKSEYGDLTYSINLGQLLGGKHSLKIIVEGAGYYGTATHDLFAGSKPSFKEVMKTKSVNNSVQYDFWVESSSNIIVSSSSEEPNPPSLSMPKEYINYTITNKNGSYWTKIQGKYPIKVLNIKSPQISIPMIYPTPPNTTNILITLNHNEITWINYTKIYPEALHHTAIGDWSMIQCILENVTESFLLEIQYEYPVQKINGNNTFLYDLNISPYLSAQQPDSTAYFTITFEVDIINPQLYTTKTDTQWNPLYYTTQNNSNTIITTQITSKYKEPLLGDLVIIFNASNSQEIPIFIITSILAFSLLSTIGLLVYFNKHRRNNS